PCALRISTINCSPCTKQPLAKARCWCGATSMVSCTFAIVIGNLLTLFYRNGQNQELSIRRKTKDAVVPVTANRMCHRQIMPGAVFNLAKEPPWARRAQGYQQTKIQAQRAFLNS